LAVGKFSAVTEVRDELVFVEDWGVAWRVVRGAEDVAGGIGWPGWVTSDDAASVVPTIVGSPEPLRVA
jgi:hypothetical protein